MSDAPIVSHGRGGQGNITRDSTKYTDGGIVREGVAGESVDGEFSSGRGGAGNIVASPKVKPARRNSHDKIPENVVLDKGPQAFHTGRGGAANIQTETPEKTDEHKESILDKARNLLHHDKKEKPGS